LVDIGPNALAAILAVVGLLSSGLVIWRQTRLEQTHATLQRQVDSNTRAVQSVVTEQMKKGE